MAQRNKFDQRGTFVRFSMPGATIPGTDFPIPDLVVKSYWQSFRVGMKEKITRTKTMGGWVEDHWPPDLDTISVSGSTGAFIIVDDPNTRSIAEKIPPPRRPEEEDANRTEFVSVPQKSLGLPSTTRSNLGLAIQDEVFMRRLSEAALNMESLNALYKNNGATFEFDGQIADIRDIEMLYMGDIYVGYFTDFNFTHSDQSPNLYTYQFTFRVKETFLTMTLSTGNEARSDRFNTSVRRTA